MRHCYDIFHEVIVIMATSNGNNVSVNVNDNNDGVNDAGVNSQSVNQNQMNTNNISMASQDNDKDTEPIIICEVLCFIQNHLKRTTQN